MVGCGADSPRWRDATPRERAQLARYGEVDRASEVLAIDLGGGRSLTAGIVQRFPKTPAMIVTDGQRVAPVSCSWDGSSALGFDAGELGVAAVRAARERFGDAICNPVE